jgi:hypothetical protein
MPAIYPAPVGLQSFCKIAIFHAFQIPEVIEPELTFAGM